MADILKEGILSIMLHILLICAGNTCRSPMAEALLKEKIQLNGLADRVTVQSAGLNGRDGLRPSAGAKAAMVKRGLTLGEHLSRRLRPDDVAAANLILTMEEEQKQILAELMPHFAGKVDSLAQFSDEWGDVFDPIGGSQESYERCACVIERLLEKAWAER